MDQPGWGTEMRRKENGEDSDLDLDLDLDGESDGDVERPSMSQVPILSSMKSHVRHPPCPAAVTPDLIRPPPSVSGPGLRASRPSRPAPPRP